MTNTPALVADHIIQAANAKLSEAVKRNFDEPKSHLQSFSKFIHCTQLPKKHLLIVEKSRVQIYKSVNVQCGLRLQMVNIEEVANFVTIWSLHL